MDGSACSVMYGPNGDLTLVPPSVSVFGCPSLANFRRPLVSAGNALAHCWGFRYVQAGGDMPKWRDEVGVDVQFDGRIDRARWLWTIT